MSQWSEFYRGRCTENYRQYASARYAPFITAIIKKIDRHSDNKNIVELGSGLGTITHILHHNLPNHTYCMLDKDPIMLIHSKVNCISARCYQRDITKVENIPQGDIYHSHGVLEHFKDEDIYNITSQLPESQIHYVPGLYDKPSFGDERLMSAEDWKAICKPDEIIKFNQGLDYVLLFN